jgi:2,5-diketo-D-gluconate reductase B
MHYVEANGAKIPAIGLGTWELRGRTCSRIVEQALRLGYRHIDTAQIYENEREVGEGLRASGVRRDEVFVTTKVWTSHFAPNDLERSAKESLARLRLTDVDLLLLHWPNSQIPLTETLGALARAKQLGLARHIGVSNFTVALIEEAAAACPEALVCDQI